MIKISEYNDEYEDLDDLDGQQDEQEEESEQSNAIDKAKNAVDKTRDTVDKARDIADKIRDIQRRIQSSKDAESGVNNTFAQNSSKSASSGANASSVEGGAGGATTGSVGSGTSGATSAGASASSGAAATGSAAGSAAAAGAGGAAEAGTGAAAGAGAAAGGAAAGGAAAGGAAAGGAAAGGAAAGTGIAAGLTAAAPVLIVVGIIILLIIFLIAAYAFFTSMPGMFMGQIKETAKDATKTILGDLKGLVTGDYVFITDDETRDLAQYLENMGYNAQGYGYADIKYTDDSPNTSEARTKTVESVTGVAYKQNNIKSYLAANEETYMLAKNSIWGTLKAKWKKISSAIASMFGMGMNVSENDFDPASYSTGLINIQGESGGVLGFFTTPNEDYAEIDRATEQLVVYSHAVRVPFLPGFLPSIKFGAKFSYDLSDWSAKYGRPTEMFIALHNATMMPDLTYKIANDDEFNTKVNMNLQNVNVSFENIEVKTNNATYSRKEVEAKYLDYVISRLQSIVDGARAAEKEAADNNETYTWTEAELNALELLPKVQALKGNEEKTHEFLMLLFECDGYITADKVASYVGASVSGHSLGTGRIMISALSGDEGSGLKDISKSQLQDLMDVLYTGYKGMEDVKMPYIESVTKHWYYKDIIFTTGKYGVYHQAKKVHKTIDYNGGDNSLKDYQIKLDAIISSDDGVYYQVNEPLVTGPNQNIIDVFDQKYYRYNGGTIDTAHKIAMAKLFDENKGGKNYIFNGQVYTLPSSEASVFTDETRPQKEYPTFGKPGDTLTAFSILREVHTPEADAVYRMLKELATSEKIRGHLEKGTLDETLTKVLLWPFKDNNDGTKEWDVKKDENQYGIKIEGLSSGEDFIAPGDGKIISKENGKTTIQFSVLSKSGNPSTVDILKKKYEDDFYKVEDDVVSGMTMIIEGVNITKSGTITRGEKIGSVSTGGTVKIVMQHKDKSLVGQSAGSTGEQYTTDDDVEDYMDDSYTDYDEQRVIDSILNRKNAATGGNRIGLPNGGNGGSTYQDGDYSEDVDDEELLMIYAITAAEDIGGKGMEGPWAVVTCAKNRALKNHGGYGTTILAQLTAKSQFDGYRGGTNPNYVKYYNNPSLIPQAVREGVDQLVKGGQRNHNFIYFNATRSGAISQANKYNISINPSDSNSLRQIGLNWYYGPDDSLGSMGPGTGTENSELLNYALQIHKAWREAGYTYSQSGGHDCSAFVQAVLEAYLNERLNLGQYGQGKRSQNLQRFCDTKFNCVFDGKTLNATDMGLGSSTAIVFKGTSDGTIGHVQIYAGVSSDGKARWYNWGSNQSADPNKYGKSTSNGDDTFSNTSGGTYPYFLYAYVIN